MIEAQQVKDCSVDIVYFGRPRAIEWFVSPLVAMPVSYSALDAAAAHPVRKHEGVVISALAALS